MTLVQAFGHYLLRLVIFAAVALCGVVAGIKIRKAKDSKEETKGNESNE